MNCGPRKNNTSGYKGVERTARGRWNARIKAYGKRRSGGNWVIKEDAARSYDRLSLIYHGEYGYLNFPEEKEERLREIAAQKY
jgi:hypothetical protein